MSGMEAAARSQAAGSADERWGAVPRHWCGGDAFETRLLEAMSLIAPEVERFVIAAVIKHVRRRDAEECAPAVMAFVHEEAEHSRVHKRFNERLSQQSIDVAKVVTPVRSAADLARRWLPTGGQLAIAAACEHLSTLLSISFLRAARRSRIRPVSVLGLFEQHARDEIGHRAIVFDLLKDARCGSLARGSALAIVSLAALVCLPRVVHALLKSEVSGCSVARGAASWMRASRWISLSVFARGWVAYLAPDFHPRHLPDA